MGLTVLHPTKEVGKQKALKVDIVAVHGLIGDPIQTWTHSRTKAFWLKDFLPLDVDGVRVMTFGYNADVAFGNSTADINDHAKDLLSSLIDKREEDDEASRPLIFIAHSLGGIIVKKALFGARIEARYHTLFENTLGIVFLGTPHRGSEKASYGDILAKVATAVMHKPCSCLTIALQANSLELQLLTSEFRHQLPKYQVVSFYERKPTKPFSTLIVEKHSALLEVDGEDQIPVDANHTDMCKFATRDDEVYEKLFKRLSRMAKGKNVEIGSGLHVATSRNKHYELPRHVSPNFTGRAEISEKLKEQCLPARKHNAAKAQTRVVLYGMGGSGKTQICLKFAQDYRDHFWGIFWIDASSNETAERGFVAIARTCGLEADFDAAKRWLAHLEEPWLMIIDNADDPRMDVGRYYPPGDRGTILLTTRNPECKIHATRGSFELCGLEPEEGITLLLRSIDAEDVSDIASRILAKPVVETLGCLALAIVQAGAVIRKGLCSLEEYCSVYSRRRKELLSDLSIQASEDYKYTVYSTFEVSVKMIEDMSDDTSRNAIEILQLFCFFHFDGISEDILKEAWKNMHGQNLSEWVLSHQIGLLRRDLSPEWDPLVTREAISLLSSFSLLTITGTRGPILIHQHPLIHSWIKDRMTEPEQKSCWLKAASTLAMSIEHNYSTFDYQHRWSLLPHIDACLSFHIGELYLEQWLNMFPGFALTYAEADQWHRALELQEKVVAGCRNAWGEEEARTLGESSFLGDIYQRAGELQKALQIFERVSETQRRILPNEHDDTLRTMGSLASCYHELGQYYESCKLGEETLAIRKRVFGEEEDGTLRVLQNLGSSYYAMGQRQISKELQEKALEILTRVLGNDNPNTVNSMINLAVSYFELGRAEEAFQLLDKALEISMRTLASSIL